VKIKYLLVISLVLVTLIAGGFTSCGKEQGNLPQYSIGDKWVLRWYVEGANYTITAEVNGSEIIQGKDCYVMTLTFDPVFMGFVVSVINKYDKATMNTVSMDYNFVDKDQIRSATFQVTGDEAYPLFVGKTYKQVEVITLTTGNSTMPSSQDSTTTTTTKVEAIETITVPAGTFKCFKVVKYDEDGDIKQISWRSADTKYFQVKMADPNVPDEIYELISYSVN
jgi:hypothetical protein